MRIREGSIHYHVIEAGENLPLDTPDRVVEYMQGAFDAYPNQESFYTINLNLRNIPLGRVLITLGTATAALVHPTEVFRPAILSAAQKVVCVHNHPSGDPNPSRADIMITRQLAEAGKILGIKILDHVIIGHSEDDPLKRGYFSFKDAGLI